MPLAFPVQKGIHLLTAGNLLRNFQSLRIFSSNQAPRQGPPTVHSTPATTRKAPFELRVPSEAKALTPRPRSPLCPALQGCGPWASPSLRCFSAQLSSCCPLSEDMHSHCQSWGQMTACAELPPRPIPKTGCGKDAWKGGEPQLKKQIFLPTHGFLDTQFPFKARTGVLFTWSCTVRSCSQACDLKSTCCDVARGVLKMPASFSELA